MVAMPYRHHTFDNADEALAFAYEQLDAFRIAGEVPVLLVPTSAAGLRARRALVEGPCAFGVRVETPDSWVADRWELFGDGRRIVEPTVRALLVRRACLEAESPEVLEPTPGTVDLLARLAREALPYLLDAANGPALEELGPSERGVLVALGRYAALLDERGLCESSQAARALPATLGVVPPLVLLGFDELSYAHTLLFEELAAQADVLRVDDGCRAPASETSRAAELQALLSGLFRPVEEPLEPTGAVRFLLPAGRYAAPGLVLRATVDAARCERDAARAEGRLPLPVVVTAHDPRALFDEVADALFAAGVTAAVAARRSFGETAFGRAFSALVSFACDERALAALASDFACSAFSGIPLNVACELDAAWRGDRTADRARVARDLAAASEPAAEALAALAEGDVDAALACFEARLLRRCDLDPAFRSEQLAAISCARDFVAACVSAGVSPLDVRVLLGRAAVSAAARTAPEDEDADVLFLSLSEASERPTCSCCVLTVCDLTASAYPVRAVEDGGTLLLERLGLDHPADPLADARRRFFRALSTARDAVVCERPLNTVDADEAYPAAMLEELLDCYRLDEGDIDRATGLPAGLVPYALTAGEEALHDNLAVTCGQLGDALGGSAISAPHSWEVPRSGEVSPSQRGRIVLPAPGTGGGEALALSPSAVESYLECPYKWFAQRRLRLSEPDAGFGPLEMGSFSHGVLKSFYEHFREAGHPKVDARNLDEARELMRDTFERHLAFQPELKRGRNPLIPRTPFEQAEARDLERKLMAYLDREVVLLPGFEPAYLEFEFGTDELFSYAGCLLRGSVDRIDVNGRGQAVVIDYKGSVTADYALSSSSPAEQAGGVVLPHKVQALMYAQVARRKLGLDVVGALYVSYGRDGRVTGAFDRAVLGEESIPGIDAEACGAPGPSCEAVGCTSFAELVDRVEEGVAEAARTLGGGFVGPDPRGKDPCGYCPVLSCERRRQA